MNPRLEALVHIASRVGGALASISVFALIARKLPAAQAQSVFFLLFTLGFAVALLRSYCMLSANLTGNLRRAERLRRVASCAQSYARLLPIAIAVLSIVFSFQSLPWWASPIVAVLACAAGYDGDLTRAVFQRVALYPWLILAGGLASLAVLSTSRELEVSGAMVAVLVGWIPAAAFGASRWFSEGGLGKRYRLPPQRRPAMRPLLVATLDGVILNAPFLGGVSFNVGGTRGYDLAIAVRVFSSSQPLFPLVAHWGNSGRLWQLAQRLRVTEAALYGLLLVSTGLIASLLFVAVFGWVSNQVITGLQFGMFVCLLLGYCAYLSQARFYAMRVPSGVVLRVCVLSLGFFLPALLLAGVTDAPSWAISGLQGGTLVFAGVAMRALATRCDTASGAIEIETGSVK